MQVWANHFLQVLYATYIKMGAHLNKARTNRPCVTPPLISYLLCKKIVWICVTKKYVNPTTTSTLSFPRFRQTKCIDKSAQQFSSWTNKGGLVHIVCISTLKEMECWSLFMRVGYLNCNLRVRCVNAAPFLLNGKLLALLRHRFCYPAQLAMQQLLNVNTRVVKYC